MYTSRHTVLTSWCSVRHSLPGGHIVSPEREPITGHWGMQSTQRGHRPGAEEVRWSEGKAPLKLFGICTLWGVGQFVQKSFLLNKKNRRTFGGSWIQQWVCWHGWCQLSRLLPYILTHDVHVLLIQLNWLTSFKREVYFIVNAAKPRSSPAVAEIPRDDAL